MDRELTAIGHRVLTVSGNLAKHRHTGGALSAFEVRQLMREMDGWSERLLALAARQRVLMAVLAAHSGGDDAA